MAISKIEPHNKVCLTVEECAGIFNIGEHTLRDLIKKDPTAKYVLRVGNKTLFKKRLFEEFIETQSEL